MAENENIVGELNVLQGGRDYFDGRMPEQDGHKIFETKSKLLKEKIREFLNLKNVYFLFGAGTSSGAIPTMKDLCKTLSLSELGKPSDEKAVKEVQEEYESIKSKTEEDLEARLSVLYSACAYFDVLSASNDDPDRKKYYEKKSETYKKLIENIEAHIFTKLNVNFAEEMVKTALGYYKVFYQKLAHRNRDNSRICVFTTNNDLFNETALDSLNINYINGFSGGLHRVFNPAIFNYTWSKRMDTSIDKYEPIENLVYLYKLHGSINWREAKVIENTYFEIEEIPPSEVRLIKEQKMESDTPILIYPTPTKQEKSLGSPYVDLFREFQNKLLEPHSVLFVIGYSFSDRHVNEIIYRALATNSSLNVVIFGKKPEENEESKRQKPIFFVNDSRIFIINGGETHQKNGWTATTTFSDGNQDKKSSAESNTRLIEHFDYIVKELLPDVSHNDDKILKDFLTKYKDLKEHEDRESNID